MAHMEEDVDSELERTEISGLDEAGGSKEGRTKRHKLSLRKVSPTADMKALEKMMARTLQAQLPSFATQTTEAITSSILPLLKKHDERLDQREAAIAACSTVQQDHTDRIAALEKSRVQLEELLTKARQSGGGMSVSTVASSGSGSGDHERSWVLGFIELKNFCDFECRETQGLTWDEAAQLVKQLRDSLPPTLQSKLGDIQVRGNRTSMIKIPVADGQAVNIQGMWKDTIAATGITVRDRTPWVICQRPPATQARMGELGRCLDGLKKYCAAHRNGVVEVMRPDWSAYTISLQVVGELEGVPRGQVEVVRVQANLGAAWDEGALGTVLQCGSGAVMALARKR